MVYLGAPRRLDKMSQLEHFQQLIEQAKAEADKLRLANLPIENWWNEVREIVVRPTLVDAAAALNGSGFVAEQTLNNGGSGIMLTVRRGDSVSASSITFTLSENVTRVSCTDRNLN